MCGARQGFLERNKSGRQYARELPWQRRQLQSLVQRRTAAFGDPYFELPTRAQGYRDTQRRRRCVAQGGHGPKQEYRRFATVRLHLESANLLRPRLRQPGEDGTRRIGLDHLLGDPQAVGGRCSFYPDHLVGRKSQLAEPTDVRFLRGRYQVQASSLSGQRWNGRPEQAPLANGRLCREELRQTAGRPTPSRQLRIERGKAGGHRDRMGSAQLRASPDRLRHMRWQGVGRGRRRAQSNRGSRGDLAGIRVRKVGESGRQSASQDCI